MYSSIFFILHSHGEEVMHNGNFYVLHHEKYTKQMLWSFNRGDGHPTNVRPLSITSVIGILGIAILMFVLFV
jgi:hypothetical protein